MSVIGSRRHTIAHTKEYRNVIDKCMVRQFLKLGSSCWHKFMASEANQSKLLKWKEEFNTPFSYIENWSVVDAVKIIFLPIFNIFKGEENAYKFSI